MLKGSVYPVEGGAVVLVSDDDAKGVGIFTFGDARSDNPVCSESYMFKAAAAIPEATAFTVARWALEDYEKKNGRIT